MAVQLTLADDEALVLLDLLASNRLPEDLAPHDRNALLALEAQLEKALVAPFSPDYLALLESARASVRDRYGS